MQQAKASGAGKKSTVGQQQVDGTAGGTAQDQSQGQAAAPGPPPPQQEQQHEHGSIPIREAKAAVVTRQDSYNDEVDEFVDAPAS